MNCVTRIIDVLQKEGIITLFRKIAKRTELKTLPYLDYWFDLKHGVETCGVVFHDNASDIASDEQREAVHYEATPVNVVRSILSKLPIDHSEYTFIDYGSGKGRVLLQASEYPFKSIIGVELSKRLHETAENNLRICRYFDQKCVNVKSCCANATQLKLPDDPLVIFFFTPFFGAVMDQVISNIQESLSANPRPLHIVYYGSRLSIVRSFSDMDFTHQEIYSRRALPAPGSYRGHLFTFRGCMTR